MTSGVMDELIRFKSSSDLQSHNHKVGERRVFIYLMLKAAVPAAVSKSENKSTRVNIQQKHITYLTSVILLMQ